MELESPFLVTPKRCLIYGSLSVTHSQYDGHDGEQDDGDADDRLGGDQAPAAASRGRGCPAPYGFLGWNSRLAEVPAVRERGESVPAAGAPVVGEGLARFGGCVEEVPG